MVNKKKSQEEKLASKTPLISLQKEKKEKYLSFHVGYYLCVCLHQAWDKYLIKVALPPVLCTNDHSVHG